MIGGSRLYSIKTAESRQETITTTKVLIKVPMQQNSTDAGITEADDQ